MSIYEHIYLNALFQVACEPSWLQNAHIYVDDWAALITAAENLLMRAAALESLLEGRSQHLRSAFFAKYFGVDLLPNFRTVYGLIAVACAKLAGAVHVHKKSTEVGGSSPILFSGRMEQSCAGSLLQMQKEQLASFGCLLRTIIDPLEVSLLGCQDQILWMYYMMWSTSYGKTVGNISG